MPHIQRTAFSPYSSKALYTLVNNIKDYPKFLPWCEQTIIHREDKKQVEATIVIKKGLITQSFTTCNTLTPYERIDLKLVKGPFQSLEGFWHFEQDKQGTQVTFSLDYTFSHAAHALLLDPIFKHMADLMVNKFITHANQLLK